MSLSNTENPLVSFIVLSYNHADFIEKTIRSISEQDYKNIEIIVIDDGSTDNSVEFLKDLQRNISFKLFEKENGGVVSAINFGVEKVSGVYTILHACDDISLPRRTSHQVSVFSSYPDASFVSSNVNLVNKDGVFKKELLKRKAVKLISLDDALLGADITSVGCIYKTDVLKKIKLNENYIAEDPQIHLSLLKNNNYAVVDYAEPVLNYYLNAGGQMGTRFEQLVLQNMKLLREYEDNKFFKKAYQRVQISYLSFLSENSKKKAFFYLFRNLNLIVVPGFQRVIVKMFLPIHFHSFFKNVRT